MIPFIGIDKFIETESILVVAGGWEEGGRRLLNGYGVSFWGNKMFWN